jgi:hypothetical protein
MMFVLKKKVRLCSAQSTMPTGPPDGKALRPGSQGDLNTQALPSQPGS